MRLITSTTLLFLLSIGSSSARTLLTSSKDITQPQTSPQPIYFLVTTSSKIYSLPIPYNFQFDTIDTESFYNAENNVIYKEQDLSNNWITDAFYVKSEDSIYVNVYNSSSSASDIFTLKYNKQTGAYVKNVLYRDQSFCLGKHS